MTETETVVKPRWKVKTKTQNQTTKAANYSARAGQTIAGNLARGGDGKFAAAGSGGGSSSVTNQSNAVSSGGGSFNVGDKPLSKVDQAKADIKTKLDAARVSAHAKINQAHSDAKAAAAQANSDAKTAAQATRAEGKQNVQTARQQQQNQNRGDTIAKVLGDSYAEMFTVGDDPKDLSGVKPEMLQDLQKRGLAAKNSDGSFDLTASGRALVNVANKGDAKGAARIVKFAQQSADHKAGVAAKHAAFVAKHPAKGGGTTASAKNWRVRVKPIETETEIKLGDSTEVANSLFVIKQADGKYRWLTFSSSGFRDKDKETVSTKALNDDCDYADRTGEYGPLLWWHADKVELGQCDFNAVSGRILIESGTFHDARVAEKLKEVAPELGVSLGFYHSSQYPDRDGVYSEIRRKERSLLPRQAASNHLTGFAVY